MVLWKEVIQWVSSTYIHNSKRMCNFSAQYWRFWSVFFFAGAALASRILPLDQGSNLSPWQWKCKVLTTRLSENSQDFDLKYSLRLKLYIIFGILHKNFDIQKIFDVQIFWYMRELAIGFLLTSIHCMLYFTPTKKVRIIIFIDYEHLTTFVLSLLSGRSVDR